MVRFFGYFHLERLRVKRRKRREKKRKGIVRKKGVNSWVVTFIHHGRGGGTSLEGQRERGRSWRR